MKVEDITLDWLYARVIERDGCLIWVRSIGKQSNSPEVEVGGRHWQVRRLIWQISHERQFPSKMEATLKCGNPHCVHPDHVVSKPYGSSKKGIKRTIDQRIKIAIGRRRKSKISDEKIDAIKTSDVSEKELIENLGIDVHRSYIGYVRAGKIRRDYSNPFAGLGA